MTRNEFVSFIQGIIIGSASTVILWALMLPSEPTNYQGGRWFDDIDTSNVIQMYWPLVDDDTCPATTLPGE